MAKTSQAKRPVLISIIGYLYMLGALAFLILGALSLLGMGESSFALNDVDMAGYASLAGGALIVVGVVFFIVAKAFLDGWTIAWYLGVILQALSLIGGLFMLPAGLVPTLISVIILYYLFRPGVKSFFKV